MKQEVEALIVDDEEDIGLMVSLFLKREGIIPTYVNTFESAESLVRTCQFDFYFLDLNLPDGVGFDLIPRINEKNSDAKIIIMSAYDSHDEITKAKEFEVKAFVKKPFTKQDILKAIEQ